MKLAKEMKEKRPELATRKEFHQDKFGAMFGPFFNKLCNILAKNQD